MSEQVSGWITAWRLTLLIIIANIVTSFGVGFIFDTFKIDDIQLCSLVGNVTLAAISIAAAIMSTNGSLSSRCEVLGVKRFKMWLIPFLILLPIATQSFFSTATLPLTYLFQFLFGEINTDIALAPNNVKEFIIAFLYLCIITPIYEEIFFRGVIYKYFEKTSTIAAIFMSAFTFTLAHLDLRSFIPIFFVGIIFGIARYATGSVTATMLAHFFTNLFSLVSLIAAVHFDTTLGNIISGVLFILFAISFPFLLYMFLTKIPRPRFVHENGQKTLSVSMILIFVIYVGLQILLIIDNIISNIDSVNYFIN